MKKNRWILLVLFMCAMVSCGKQKNTFPTQSLRLALTDDPFSFDPRSVRSLKDLTVVKQLYDGLMRLDAEGVPQPAVAESVEISDDLLTYTFHLKETYWSNHQPVTAYDFEHAWTQLLQPEFMSAYAYMLYPIQNAQFIREGGKGNIDVEVKDEKTLVVRLHTPTPYFLELLAFPTYFPVPRSEDPFISNGPFCLKKWTPQIEVILEKNPTYWDSEAVHLDLITFSIINDNNTENHLYEKGELDWLGQPISNSIAADALSRWKKEGKVASYQVAGTFWYKFNTEREPFTNQNFRKAFAYALNRDELITHVLQGSQSSATGILPLSMKLSESPYFEDGNTKKAQEFLQQAFLETGWTLETLPPIKLTYPPSERNRKIVQVAQQQLQKSLGITLELCAEEAHLYRRNINAGLFQVGPGEWIADFNDPIAFLELFKVKVGMHDTKWENAHFTDLLNHSLVETDPVKRARILKEAEEVLISEMPIAPLYHYAWDYVKKPSVQGTLLSPLGIADFKTTYIQR